MGLVFVTPGLLVVLAPILLVAVLSATRYRN
jgi:hypothetical protein